MMLGNEIRKNVLLGSFSGVSCLNPSSYIEPFQNPYKGNINLYLNLYLVVRIKFHICMFNIKGTEYQISCCIL